VVNATRVGEKLGFSYVWYNGQFVRKPNSVNSLIISCTENVQLEITKRNGGRPELYGKRTRTALVTACNHVRKTDVAEIKEHGRLVHRPRPHGIKESEVRHRPRTRVIGFPPPGTHLPFNYLIRHTYVQNTLVLVCVVRVGVIQIGLDRIGFLF
jgi:hypothetical protein